MLYLLLQIVGLQIYRVLPFTLPQHVQTPVMCTDFLFSKAYRAKNSYFLFSNIGGYGRVTAVILQSFLLLEKYSVIVLCGC